MHTETLKRWEQLTAAQYGVVSRTQARALGLSRGQVDALVARGSWIRMFPGVYRVAAAPATWKQPLMGACLWAEGKGVICGRAAAALWGFENYWRTRVELCGRSDLTPPAGILFRQVKGLSPADVTTKAGIRVTSVARTLLDLTSVVSLRTLERTLDEALRKKQVTLVALFNCMARNGRRGRKRIGDLQALLDERRGQQTTDSALESDVAALIRAYHLPIPVKRYRVIEQDRFIAEVDLAWPKEKLAIQVHGASYHRQLRTWENDQRVENLLQLGGWRVVKITARMLEEDPEQLTGLIEAALAQRS